MPIFFESSFVPYDGTGLIALTETMKQLSDKMTLLESDLFITNLHICESKVEKS